MKQSLNPVEIPQYAKYGSPFAFEQIDDSTRKEEMFWIGPLFGVTEDLGLMAAKNSLGSDFWHPSRLLRAVIDSNVPGSERIALVNQVSSFAIGMYAGNPDADLLGRITSKLHKYNLTQQLVYQIQDDCTVEASDASLSLASATKISTKTQDPLLVIPLCHGGFVAGVQTMLYQKINNPQADIITYPLRHSRDKHRDWVPHITKEEAKYLREIADGRTIVIFDEDAVGGDSVLESARFMRHKISKATILGIVNLDARSDNNKLYQGEWWENHRAITPKFILSLAGTAAKRLIKT